MRGHGWRSRLLQGGSAGQNVRAALRDPRVRFVLIGAGNTAFSTTLFALLVLVLGPGVPSAVSLGIAWSISLVVAFSAYRYLVFRVSGHVLRDFFRFAGVNVGALLINAAALTLLVEVMGLPPIPVQISITILIVIFNYYGHRHFSFRRRAVRNDGGGA